MKANERGELTRFPVEVFLIQAPYVHQESTTRTESAHERPERSKGIVGKKEQEQELFTLPGQLFCLSLLQGFAQTARSRRSYRTYPSRN
jgi:hypothetical protein